MICKTWKIDFPNATHLYSDIALCVCGAIVLYIIYILSLSLNIGIISNMSSN